LRFSRGPSRDFGVRAALSLARSPARGSTLVRSPSPAGSFSVRRVAPCRLAALPPRRFDDLGVFLVGPCRGTGAPRLPSWGQVLSRALRASPPPARPFSDPAPSRRSRAVSGPGGSASRGVLAPADTTTSGAPSPSRSPSRSCVRDEDRQTLVGAVLRVLAPLDGSGWLATTFGLPTYEAFWTPPFAVAPDASRPSFMPLASLERPSRAFPSRGAVPALAGLLLPCGFDIRSLPAQCLQEVRGRFPRLCQLFAARARPEADPGRMSRDDGSSQSLVRSPRRAQGVSHVPSCSYRHWARR